MWKHRPSRLLPATVRHRAETESSKGGRDGGGSYCGMVKADGIVRNAEAETYCKKDNVF